MRRLKVCVEIFPFFSGVFKRVYSLQEFHLGKKKGVVTDFFFFCGPPCRCCERGFFGEFRLEIVAQLCTADVAVDIVRLLLLLA